MTKFHAVMLDETRCEFGVSVTARSVNEAFKKLSEAYPESRCVQLESPKDRARREYRLYRNAQCEYDGENLYGEHGSDDY